MDAFSLRVALALTLGALALQAGCAPAPRPPVLSEDVSDVPLREASGDASPADTSDVSDSVATDLRPIDQGSPSDLPDGSFDAALDAAEAPGGDLGELREAALADSEVPGRDLPLAELPGLDVTTAPDVPAAVDLGSGPEVTAGSDVTTVPDAQRDVMACPGALCGGVCVDTQRDLSHCGRCDGVCPARVNATAVCTSGACGLQCAAGFGDCDGSGTNGCETDTRVSRAHCGACANACPTVSNGRSTCASGACALSCDPGFVLRAMGCEPTAVRLLHPMSTATVSSLRPTLRFVPAAGLDGTRVQICADRRCETLEQTIDATGASARPATALSAGVHFWRATSLRAGAAVGLASAPWEFVVGRRDTPVDTSWGAMPDVNGDGLGDAVVGSQGGEVQVFHGASAGLSATAASTLRPSDGESTFGFAVASAGDVNGDGYGDVIVGARNAGVAYIYHGGPAGLSATASSTLTGMSEASFGASVTSVGDIDRDGYGDVAIGAPGMPLMAIPGIVFVYLGSARGIDPSTRRTLLPGESVLVFGFALSSAGDVNGDGFEDLLAGAPGYVTGIAGSVYVFYGGPSGPPATPSVRYLGTVNTFFGFPVANAGDLNGDGYSDLATGLTLAGRVAVYHGGPAGPSAVPDRVLSSPLLRADFGRYIAGAGDLNADGFGDILVGADFASRVYVYYGSSMGLGASAELSLSGAAGSNFGRCAASPGDTNGDGFPEVLVSAPTVGEVNVYPGSGPRGLITTPSVTLRATVTDFGYALAGL